MLQTYWFEAHGAKPMEEILGTLTPSLRTSLKHHIFVALTQRVPIFQPEGDPPLPDECIRRCAADTNFMVYNAGEWVLRVGMETKYVFIVASICPEAQTLDLQISRCCGLVC